MATIPSLTEREIEVRKALPEQTSALGAVLGRAFFNEPLMAWAMPDGDRRNQLLPSFFQLFVRTMDRYNENYVAGDALGAALWAPPGNPVVSDDEGEAFGHELDDIVGIDAPRFAEIFALLDEHHPNGSFFYLQFIGVEPSLQRRGIGSSLLITVLERCDRLGLPAALDATSAQSMRLYERHGFEATKELSLPNGPLVWPMWRKPIGRGS
jgi:GNAT superfamily N-acetyltransferase